MNIQQLEYILALDKYKSFSKAADSCFITQATLSTMVKKLEDELDLVLFDRKTQPIITTEYGKKIIEEAQKIIAHTQRLKQLSLEIKGKIEGELKIGIIPTIAGNLLHRILPGIMEKFPLLKLSIKEITTENLINQLKTGELDAGILSTPLSKPELEEELLYYEKLLVYSHSKQASTQYYSPKEIRNEKLWLLERGNCLTDQVINLCSLNLKKINTALNFQPNTFESLINIVDQFEGLTLIPELYFKDLSVERKQHVRDFTPPFPVREISIVYFRPYAKLNLIQTISAEIKKTITPILMTDKLKNKEMLIAKM
jgi:LysR family transcriptional regulator, hydrogen peroxide-inducible genes activator